MTDNIQIYDSLDDLNSAFTEWLKERLAEKDQITIALSGGSTPKKLFDYWAKLPAGEIDWTKIMFYWGDERCVPPTNAESNYKMTKDHLFDHVVVPQENIFRIHGENDPQEEAKRYGALLPVFDIMMLGMGDDGHTASIFPHEMALWESKENCVVATHPETGQKRVSVTGKVINASTHVVFLVTGANKADKVKEVIGNPHQAQEIYPAARVQPASGNLTWFTDHDATRKLTGGS